MMQASTSDASIVFLTGTRMSERTTIARAGRARTQPMWNEREKMDAICGIEEACCVVKPKAA